MVVHDQDCQQRWTQQREEQQKRKRKERPSVGRHWSVLGVQSLACVAVLLLAFALRFAGGGAYEKLKEGFRGALAENQLMAVFSGLFEGGETGVKTNGFTDKNSAKNQAVAPDEGDEMLG